MERENRRYVVLSSSAPGSDGEVRLLVTRHEFNFLENVVLQWNEAPQNQKCAAPFLELKLEKG